MNMEVLNIKLKNIPNMNKRIYLMIMVLLMVIGGVKAQTVDIHDVTASPGNIMVQLDMLNYTIPVGAITLEIGYDAALMDFNGITANPSFPGMTASATGGIITIGYFNMAGVPINGKLTDLMFDYNGGFAGELAFSDACEIGSIYANIIPSVFTDGSVTQIATTNTVTLASPGLVQVGSMATVPVKIIGPDMDAVNAITLKVAYDPTKLAYIGLTPHTLTSGVTANATGGVVTIIYSGAAFNFTSVATLFDMKFTYYGGGNADLTFVPGCEVSENGAKLPVNYANTFVAPAAAAPSLTIASVNGIPGQSVTVPIDAATFGAYQVGAITLKIGYDNTKLIYTGFTILQGSTTGWTASASNGVLTMVRSSTTALVIADNALLNLKFNYVGGGSVPIGFNAGCELKTITFANIPVGYFDGNICNPSISVQPTNSTIVFGNNATFTITAANACYYQWQVLIPSSSWADITDDATYSGATTATLTVNTPGLAFDDNLYRCELVPTINSTQVAIIFSPALITTEPIDQTVNLGAIATFSVTATGVATYQWEEYNGVTWGNIADGGIYSGASSNTLTLTGVVAAMNGYQYRCNLLPGNVTTAVVDLNVNPLIVNSKVILQGSYNGTNMNTSLNAILPLNQPYNVTPWFYAGTETVASIPNVNIVDWVLVELRTGTGSGTIVDTKAGFILKDGSIVGLDGASSLSFPTRDLGNYYIVVRHRNHLSIMSATSQPLSSISVLYDFTDASAKAYGATTPMASLSGGKFGLWGGDVNKNGNVRYNGPGNDPAAIFSAIGNVVTPGYLNADVNMNGNARYNGPSNDKASIFTFVGNSVKSTQVP
jgi:hypothetical protein